MAKKKAWQKALDKLKALNLEPPKGHPMRTNLSRRFFEPASTGSPVPCLGRARMETA